MSSHSQSSDASAARQANSYLGQSIGELQSLAATLEAGQRWEELSALLDHLLAQFPQDATIWYKKGRTLYRRGLRNEALHALEQAASLLPNEVKITQALEAMRQEQPASTAEASPEPTYQQRVIAAYLAQLTSPALSLDQRLHAAYALTHANYQVAKRQLRQVLTDDADLRRAIIAKHDTEKRSDANRMTHWVEDEAASVELEVAGPERPAQHENSASKVPKFLGGLFGKKTVDRCVICGKKFASSDQQHDTFTCPKCGARACVNCAPLGGKPMCPNCRRDME